MLGFGKNKNKDDQPTPKKEKKEEKEPLPEVAISDDSITTMPEQYRPQGSSKSSSVNSPKKNMLNGRLIMIAGGIVIVLIGISVGIYFLAFNKDTPQQVTNATNTANTTQNQTSDVTTPDETQQVAEPQNKVVTGQAFGGTNQLIGALNVTVPSSVVDSFGEALGITVLSFDDFDLPAGYDYAGGLFSLYPIGVTFSEAISGELSASNVAAGVDRESYYPASLAGTTWREIEGYSLTQAGWSFEVSKFPTGPITLIRKLDDVATDTGDLVVERVVSAQDTDADGLTDPEELLFGTSATAADSDGDSYLDKAELMSGYSPVSVNETLEASGLMSTYVNTTYGYSISYPAVWLADSLDQTNKQVLFISDTEEFFEILIEENPLDTPIVDWYRGQSPALADIDLDVTIVAGRPAVWSPDHLTLYVGKEGLVYIITYNKGTLDAISWPTVYELFYKSFSFGNTSSGNGETSGSDTTATTTPETTG